MKLLAILTTLLLCGCSSLFRGYEPVAVAKVKRVAVVGIASVQPIPPRTVGGGIQRKSSHVNEIYVALIAGFKKQTGWNVLDFNAVSHNSSYAQTYKSTMEGFQNKMPPLKGFIKFVSPEIMDHDSVRILDFKGREKLMDQLKVDAIISASVDSQLQSDQLRGYISFQVYGKGQESPIWFDNNVEGDPIAPSRDELDLINQDTLNPAAVRFAKGAISKIAKPSVQK